MVSYKIYVQRTWQGIPLNGLKMKPPHPTSQLRQLYSNSSLHSFHNMQGTGLFFF